MTKLLNKNTLSVNLSSNKNMTTNIAKEGNLKSYLSIAKGEKGDTPIKGVDYFTEEDKQEVRELTKEEVKKETKNLVDTINNEIEKIGLDISKLNETDLDLKASLEGIIKKMENLVRYSKGEIHKVIIY